MASPSHSRFKGTDVTSVILRIVDLTTLSGTIPAGVLDFIQLKYSGPTTIPFLEVTGVSSKTQIKCELANLLKLIVISLNYAPSVV